MIVGPAPGPIDETTLRASYPWPRERWVRAMMAMTLDGAVAGPDGVSGSISSTADRVVLSTVRHHADAVVIGAGTLRAERYGPLRVPADVVEVRRREGRADHPRLVVVSRSLALPWDLDLWTQAPVPPLVVTAGDPDRPEVAQARSHVAVEVLVGETVDPDRLIERLAELGLTRVVVEGGPHLLAQVVRSGCLDEIDLTLSPVMVGGGQEGTGAAGDPRRFDLAHVIAADGFLFTRYLARPD